MSSARSDKSLPALKVVGRETIADRSRVHLRLSLEGDKKKKKNENSLLVFAKFEFGER